MQNKEITFIASWNIEIPPKWYWAVEDIIWNYKIFLEKDWYKVKIVNTKNIFKLIKWTVFVKNKILHFHDEKYLIISYFLNRLFFRNNKIFWTCHNWYIVWWKESRIYKIISKFVVLCRNTTYIAISWILRDYFVNLWFKWKTIILPNWVNTENFKKINKPKKDIVYLWLIEDRKWQELFLKYSWKYKIDFIWPYPDKIIDLKQNNYLWTWTKEDIYNKLWEYKVLVLLSKSEWDPLVVKEWLSAWCSILTSKIWWINLEETDFIKIIDIKNEEELDNIDNYLLELIKNNEKNREKILKYAKKFDYENIIKKYETTL
jgi:hypothetical protein